MPFSSPTPPINRSRHFATPSRFFRNRHHQRRPRPATPPSGRAPATQNDALSSTELREAGEQLAQINQNLRNLLERPLDDRRRRFGDVDRSRAEVDLDQVARKRRRMDQETSAKMCPRITYGFHGQIAPGRLKMEVSDALHGIDAVDTVASNQNHDLLQPHPVQNVVKNDKTIYAAPGSQCNIVLQHPGLTGFTVKRIIIKTPRHPVAVPWVSCPTCPFLLSPFVFVVFKLTHPPVNKSLAWLLSQMSRTRALIARFITKCMTTRQAV